MVFLMGNEETDKISLARRNGMLSMFEEEELSFTTLYGDSSYESGIDLAEKAISQNPLPDIILCTNNYIAMACLQVARHKGLDIPDTIAIMTFDNYPFSMLVSKRSLPILLIRDSILLSKTRPFKLRQILQLLHSFPKIPEISHPISLFHFAFKRTFVIGNFCFYIILSQFFTY